VRRCAIPPIWPS